VPFADSFDSGQGWTPAGAWRLDAASQGLGWFADSTARDQASSLTFGTLIDLRGAAYPQLSIWQKAVLTGGESLAVEISWMAGCPGSHRPADRPDLRLGAAQRRSEHLSRRGDRAALHVSAFGPCRTA